MAPPAWAVLDGKSFSSRHKDTLFTLKRSPHLLCDAPSVEICVSDLWHTDTRLPPPFALSSDTQVLIKDWSAEMAKAQVKGLPVLLEETGVCF